MFTLVGRRFPIWSLLTRAVYMEWISIFLVGFTLLSVIFIERVKIPFLKKILEWMPAILFAYIIPALFTHSLGLDLSKVSLHAVSKDFIMPLAIIFVMSALSFKQLKAILSPG